MSVWLSYSLSDFLLFSPRTYYRLFELYNEAVWPAHVLAAAFGIAILWLQRSGTAWRGRAIAAGLAGCWLWVAWGYHLTWFDPINWAARYFAIAFAIEALLLAWSGAVRGRLGLRPGADFITRAGMALFIFALVVQPLLGPLLGRPWAQIELFGLAPDPTAAATLGIVLMADRPKWHLLVIPLIWCATTGATLWAMQSPEALLMPIIAAVALVLAGWKSVNSARPAEGT